MKTNKNKTFDKSHYEGSSPSTLCLGCGHDQVSKHIVKAFHLANVDPFKIAKISGIGCSSKTPNYFLKQARGFNTIHGRMASVATGVKMANRQLKVIGISGDGDTGSIGLGSFLHTVRKNIPMIYIVENNGVYGLTKGQFSATAKKDSSLKYGKTNPLNTMDLCHLALSAGCGFVARAFSGDGKQLVSILQLALAYEGLAFIDVISPCVAYGNEPDFPHSFSFMKKEKKSLQELDIIVESEPINMESPSIDTEKGLTKIPLPNGNLLILKKLDEQDHDPSQKDKAWQVLEESATSQKIATGLIYYKKQDHFLKNINLSEKTLSFMNEEEIRPPAKELTKILNHYR